MPASDIESRVRSIICAQRDLAPEDVKIEAHFIDDLEFDSLDIFDLVAKLEDEFEISIPDEDAESIATVGNAVSYIQDNT
jgi:acyl carrier protein